MIPAPTAQKRIWLVLNPSAETSNQNETDVAATDLLYDSFARTWGRKLGEGESSVIRAYPIIQLVKIGLSENRCSGHLER